MAKESNGYKVLVVDDEEDVREIIAHFFKRKGYEVEEASSGNKAIAIVLEKQFDLIITDCRMPDGTGIDLIDSVMATEAPRPQIIMVSGFADIKPAEILSKGAIAFLDKPIDRKNLLKIAEEALESVKK